MTRDRSSDHQEGGFEKSEAGGLPILKVESLLGDKREAILLHGSERYRLRITQNGKLILTK